MKKKYRFVAALLAALLAGSGCVSVQERQQNLVQGASDRLMYSAFFPSPYGEKSGYEVFLYDETISVTRRFATVDFIGEAEQRYLAATRENDPVLETYLSVAKKRGSIVKAYKGILNQRLFAMPGVVQFRPEYRKMAKEDNAYLEFDRNGKLLSAYVRRAAFSNGALGIGVYSEHAVLTGNIIRSAENRISNRDIEDAFLREVRF